MSNERYMVGPAGQVKLLQEHILASRPDWVECEKDGTLVVSSAGNDYLAAKEKEISSLRLDIEMLQGENARLKSNIAKMQEKLDEVGANQPVLTPNPITPKPGVMNEGLALHQRLTSCKGDLEQLWLIGEEHGLTRDARIRDPEVLMKRIKDHAKEQRKAA